MLSTDGTMTHQESVKLLASLLRASDEARPVLVRRRRVVFLRSPSCGGGCKTNRQAGLCRESQGRIDSSRTGQAHRAADLASVPSMVHQRRGAARRELPSCCSVSPRTTRIQSPCLARPIPKQKRDRTRVQAAGRTCNARFSQNHLDHQFRHLPPDGTT